MFQTLYLQFKYNKRVRFAKLKTIFVTKVQVLQAKEPLIIFVERHTSDTKLQILEFQQKMRVL